MRHGPAILLVVLVGTFGATPAVAQKGYDLFQQALVKEKAGGQIEQAIALYRQIAREYATDRPLASKALLQLGKVYETLGSTEARAAYERVVREYADQRDAALEARSRLTALRSGPPDSAGLVARLVWDDARDAFFAGGLSADGRYLSYIEPNDGSVAVRDLVKDTSYTVARTGWLAYATAVSPDGRNVAYEVWEDTARLDAIHIADLRGAHDRILYRSAESRSAWPIAWSRDGEWLLALFIRHDHVKQIALVRVADGSSKVLKSLDVQPTNPRAAISPDGRWIAYSFPPSAQSRNGDVYLLAADGSREATVVQHPADDFVIGWTPDGHRLVIGSDRTGEQGVWALPVTDGHASGPLALVRPAVDGSPLGITARGDYYYGLYAGWNDVFVAEIDSATGRVVSPPVQAIQQYEGANSAPAWSPDGKALVARSARGRSDVALLVRSFENGSVREIHPQVDRMNFHFLSWAPHANAVLVVGAGADGQYGYVFRVDLATGDAESIAQPEPEGAIWMPEWSPDGRSVFFSRSGPTGRRLVRRVVATGEETELYRTGRIFWARVSPTGSEVAFVEDDSIKVLHVADRAVRTVAAPGKSVSALAWSRDGTHLLYGVVVDTTTQLTQLMRVAVGTGAVQQLDLAMEHLMHLKVNPDGRHIAFTAKVRDERVEVWAIEKLFAPRDRTAEPGRGH